MRTLRIFGWLLLLCAPLADAHSRIVPQERVHTLTGEIRTHKNFHSRFLSADRDIIVWLPPGYDRNKKRRYPV
ncbi:MAG TPA: hypothetical protein VGC64_05600, partial [Pyrinomonadaceae bacterium]